MLPFRGTPSSCKFSPQNLHNSVSESSKKRGIFFLEVFLHSKVKLLNENLFESIQIILLAENEHCLLVVDGVNRAETQRAVAISYQDSIAGDTSCTLVSIGKSLDI